MRAVIRLGLEARDLLEANWPAVRALPKALLAVASWHTGRLRSRQVGLRLPNRA